MERLDGVLGSEAVKFTMLTASEDNKGPIYTEYQGKTVKLNPGESLEIPCLLEATTITAENKDDAVLYSGEEE